MLHSVCDHSLLSLIPLLSAMSLHAPYFQCVFVSFLSPYECAIVVGNSSPHSGGMELYHGSAHCHLELQELRLTRANFNPNPHSNTKMLAETT